MMDTNLMNTIGPMKSLAKAYTASRNHNVHFD
jgi:hypothetical protein